MEGDAEESGEKCRVEDRPTVLWEKCIQQSIFVDLSEDESLHLSDLENSLALRVSQTESAASEPSVHLGSTELSALGDTSSASSSVHSSQSDRVVQSKTKSSILHVSAQRPNTIQAETPLKHEDSGQHTSDEDQEDLPFDGDLGSVYFNQTANSDVKMSADGREKVHASPDVPGMLEYTTRDEDDFVKRLVSVEPFAEKPTASSQADANTNLFHASKPREVAQSCPRPSGIDKLLLRHFSQEELLQPCRLIEAETLPEVSLLESVDDTVFSRAPTHNSTTMNSHLFGSPPCNIEMNQSLCSGRTGGRSASERISTSEEDSMISSSASIHSEQCSRDASALYEEQQERANVDEQALHFPLVRARSFTEMKYGQGQVHYRLPDFSKVSPKVKIPKTPNGPSRSVPHSPGTMHTAQSCPGVLEVINRVLEDSVQPSVKPYVFKDEEEPSAPALVHHLQAKYDKLLTKYAEAENRIDQMRIGNNPQPASETMLYLKSDDDQDNLVEGGHLGSVARHFPQSGEEKETSPHCNNEVMNTTPRSQPEEGPSDGERMTTELSDIISQFAQKVEGFKLSVSVMSVSTAEQQVMLRSILEAQDQLEREYISRKEEHRALEMQSYMGLFGKTGIFDPNRLVEGDIFRIGMQLEDIKEMIDRNVCEQISPPHSSSTPTPMKEMLHEMEPCPLGMPTPSPSPPPSLLKRPSAGFSTVGNKMEDYKEDENEAPVVAIEVRGDEGFQQSSDLITSDSFLERTGHSYCHSRSSAGSLEAEDERIFVSSKLTHQSNILANLSRSSLSSRERRRNSFPNPHGECDPVECVSFALEVWTSTNAPRDSDSHVLLDPPLNTSSVSQRIVSPETDSGFGSSYLNQSPSGPLQPNLLAESGRPQNVGLSSSDSEGFVSNMQTAIHSASLSSQRWASPDPPVQAQSCAATAAVERWVESTTKPSIRLHAAGGSTAAQLHQHVSAPVLITAMDAEERGSPLYSCSCNSEAILALQSEVSRLKNDLEEGLVQLPHLAHKMDFLTSKYRQNRHERKSKKTHHGPDYDSVWKPSCTTENVSELSSSQMRTEYWISSNMDKGTASSATSGSEIMLEIPSPPVESIRGRVPSTHESQYKLHESLQSNRGSEGHSLSGLTRSILKGGKASDRYPQQRQKTAMDRFYSRERWSPLTSPLQKPLLQVAYGSSSSLPASYKVKESCLRPASHHRKRSTQSDTALLPSNVYFQRTPSPAPLPSKTGSRRRGTKGVEMNRTLDQAIEVARSMKRTTDQMARRLSADLAEAHCHRRVHSVQPQGGRKHLCNQQTTDQFTL
ncbi:uncharacterized protein aknad1 isoform 2-T2 [Spinachia spinachia]